MSDALVEQPPCGTAGCVCAYGQCCVAHDARRKIPPDVYVACVGLPGATETCTNRFHFGCQRIWYNQVRLTRPRKGAQAGATYKGVDPGADSLCHTCAMAAHSECAHRAGAYATVSCRDACAVCTCFAALQPSRCPAVLRSEGDLAFTSIVLPGGRALASGDVREWAEEVDEEGLQLILNDLRGEPAPADVIEVAVQGLSKEQARQLEPADKLRWVACQWEQLTVDKKRKVERFSGKAKRNQFLIDANFGIPGDDYGYYTYALAL